MPAWRVVARLLVPMALTLSCGDEQQRDTSSSGGAPPDGGAPCAPGELETGDGCLAAGLPPEMPPCPPGETPVEAGGCVPAGVPPDACGEGFAPEDGGCVAILPEAACPDGEMALPGERACKEVAPCAGGTWGDIPVDATTQHVDGGYPGGDSDGTSARPWTSIQDGIDAALPGAVVAIAAGVYAENVVIAVDPVTLWGRCPGLVEIAGVSTSDSSVFVLAGADGAQIRNLAVTGPWLGITVSGSTDVIIDSVWVHGTAERGINLEDTQGLTTVAVRRTLVEDAHFLGIANVGSSMTLEQTVVRRTVPIGAQPVGRGILVQASEDRRASAVIRQCVVRSNREFGISIVGADATIESSLVIDTQVSGGTGFGIGIADDGGRDGRSAVTVASSVIHGNHTSGVLMYGSDVTIDATVVRDTMPTPGKEEWGRGIYADTSEATGERTTLSLTRSLVERNHDVGVFVIGSEAAVDGTLVRQTRFADGELEARGIVAQYQPLTGHRARLVANYSAVSSNEGAGVVAIGSDLELRSTVIADTLPGAGAMGGSGVAIVPWEDGTQRSSAVVHACLVERNRHSGILVHGSDATVEATIVRDTAPQESDGHFGWGLELRARTESAQRAAVTVRSCIVEGSTQLGVVVEEADVTVEASIVRDVRAGFQDWGVGIVADDGTTFAERTRIEIRGSVVENTLGFGVEVINADAILEGTRITSATPIGDGRFGDGLGLGAFTAPATALVTRTLVENSGRAGITNFGGHLTLGSTTIACNPIDIAGEVFEVAGGAPDRAPTFDNLGENVCGCQGTTIACAAETVDLEAPEPVDLP